MSLLGWLGKSSTTRSLSPLLERPTRQTDHTVLGIIGTRSNVRYEDFEMNIIGPVIEAWGVPDELILPADSESTEIFQSWASRKGVPVRFVACDWVRQGKRAGMLRDARIQREATHLVLLQGPRSNTLSELAARLSRKGRPVVISERPTQPVKSVDPK
jgi:hypothetical protein